jgi:hypothetical protein
MRAAIRWLVFQRMLLLAQTTGTGSLQLARRLRGVVAYADAKIKLHLHFTFIFSFAVVLKMCLKPVMIMLV